MPQIRTKLAYRDATPGTIQRWERVLAARFTLWPLCPLCIDKHALRVVVTRDPSEHRIEDVFLECPDCLWRMS